jgi:hypothetical protein
VTNATNGIITSDRFNTYKIGTLERIIKVAMRNRYKTNTCHLVGGVVVTAKIKTMAVINLVRGSSR